MPVAPALQYLEGLHEKLDFANASRTNLQVDSHAPGPCLGIDLSLERGQAFEHAVVVILAEHEWLQQQGQVRAAAFAAADDARLDHGILFPFAPVKLVIVFQRAVAEHYRSRISPGAQAQINPVNEAIGGAFAEHLG